MTSKQVDSIPGTVPPPSAAGLEASTLPSDLTGKVAYSTPTDEDMNAIASMRAGSSPWRERGETTAESLEVLLKLRPFISVGKFNSQPVGYVTIERDGPVPGAAYMRNIVVKPELRKHGLGAHLLEQALKVARDMNRKTLALRVDPANAVAVNFYRKSNFTTVATVVSKKSGKLRLLMSREL